MRQLLKSISVFVIGAFCLPAFGQQPVGVFDGQSNIGRARAGLTRYDEYAQAYSSNLTSLNPSSGAKQFHYIWKKMKGDFIVQMQGAWVGKDRNTRRGFGWMVRSMLDTSSSYVLAEVQSDALTSLKYKSSSAKRVHEQRLPETNVDVVQLERRDNKFIMSVAKFGEPFTTSEITGLELGDEVYVGIYLTSQENHTTQKAVFKNVRMITPAGKELVPYKDYLGSYLEEMNIATGDRRIIHTSSKSLQAPNYTADGRNLIYNSEGLIHKFNLETRTSEVINTDFVTKNNNDHVLSMDGQYLGLSSSSGDPKLGSIIYTVPVSGGKPVQITATGPSYLHGWSPDNKYLTYTGQRNGEFDIYKIPVSGGAEVRLTSSPGLDDGSEYSPDGKFIYYNSVRSGTMQIWRMRPDGSEQEQITSDEYNNWFPHISPDGKWIAFLSFMKDVPPSDHPFYKPVYIRLLPTTGGQPGVIAYVYGGQGTMNTPNWSPDSKKLAFISNSDLKEIADSQTGTQKKSP